MSAGFEPELNSHIEYDYPKHFTEEMKITNVQHLLNAKNLAVLN